LRDAADSKQLHTAMAAANGLMAAELARDGFKGARRILEGSKGLAAGMSTDAEPARLVDRLGIRWATLETSFKYYAACRHAHPAADAFLQVVQSNALRPADIERVVTHVHQGAIDVLGAVDTPATVHQAKFSMGTVLGLVAKFGYAGVVEFEEHFSDDDVAALRRKVSMALDDEVDAAYPERWIGKVTVTTRDGRVLNGRVDEPKGDPGNTLTREEIAEKLRRLVRFSGALDAQEAERVLANAWALPSLPHVGKLLSR
jgi:2-methylcitrate dehydratase PrpD